MKIFAAIYICGKFERQRDIFQRNLKKEKGRRCQNAQRDGGNAVDPKNSSSGKTAASFAIDILVAERLGVPTSKVAQYPKYHYSKKALSDVKTKGENHHSLEVACGIPIWTLIPAQEVESPCRKVLVHPKV
jgi:hypothetical protein